MRAKLDVVRFNTLSGPPHFTALSNSEYLAMLRGTLWDTFSLADREMFEKVLAKERRRQIVGTDLAGTLRDGHGERYERYREQITSLVTLCVDNLVADQAVPLNQ